MSNYSYHYQNSASQAPPSYWNGQAWVQSAAPIPSAVGYVTAADLDPHYQSVAAWAGQRYPAPSEVGTASSHYTDSSFNDASSQSGLSGAAAFNYHQQREAAKYAPASVGGTVVPSSLGHDWSSQGATVSSTTTYVDAGKSSGGFMGALKKRQPMTSTWYTSGHPSSYHSTTTTTYQQAPAQQPKKGGLKGMFSGLAFGKDHTQPLIYRKH